MYLRSIRYQEWAGQRKQWTLTPFDVLPINLFVGKNAAGKTRVLNVISGLANMLANSPLQHGRLNQLPTSGEYEVAFEEHGVLAWRYSLKLEKSRVTYEVLADQTGKAWLERAKDGVGRIWFAKNNEYIEFQTPDTQLAIVAREDSIQHPFLSPLIDWAKSVYLYRFGTQLGQNNIAVISESGMPPDLHDAERAIAIFNAGRKKFPDAYVPAIISDMAEAGYEISEIELRSPQIIQIQGVPNSHYLHVTERDLPAPTEQAEMSTGMYRVLVILILLNYAWLTRDPMCVLIDDIGEGLDFDRAKSLIGVLTRKARAESTQLLMSTNDRFVMNSTPLEHWQVLRRSGNSVSVYNHKNSKKLFDDFRLSGLNNFDFFAMDFANPETLNA